MTRMSDEKRLTDDQVTSLLAACDDSPHPEMHVLEMALRELAELRQPRASALTDAMGTNLRRLVDVIQGYYARNGMAPTGTTLDLCAAVNDLLATKGEP